MELATISMISKAFHISTRTLRYYEKLGLINAQHTEDYAYRLYDENNVRRLQVIMILRKLRIPLKQIAVIMGKADRNEIINILNQNLSGLNEELTALKTIRDVLSTVISQLNCDIRIAVDLDLLKSSGVMEIVETLSQSKRSFQEGISMDQLNKANETAGKLRNVRIVLLPPCTVASYHVIGDNPEEAVGEVIDQFVRESKLYEIKPDARMFGFNHPNPTKDHYFHGYEDWVTIPDDMEVPAPIVKKRFEGGMYAAHTIAFPEFQEWDLLYDWAKDNEKYVPNYSERGEEIMCGCLEEHLNWVYCSHMGWPENGIDGYLDLLLPVKLKNC